MTLTLNKSQSPYLVFLNSLSEQNALPYDQFNDSNVNQDISINNTYHALPILCYFCGLCFDNMSNFELHMQFNHYHPGHVMSNIPNTQSLVCDPMPTDAEFNDQCGSMLLTEMTSDNRDMYGDYIPNSSTCLPQTDGIIDLPNSPSMSDLSSVSHHTRTAEFFFNQDKQERAIQADAQIEDYTVTVNNYDENCSIKCSSGFYMAVAKPCFMSLQPHSMFSYYDVAITVTDVSSMTDKNGYEATEII